jgi:hypothetical protein
VLIFPPSLLHIDRWLKQGAQCAAVALGAVVAGLLLFFFIYPWSSSGFITQGVGSMQKGGRTYFPYEAIGNGALALRPRHALGWVSRLADELTLIAYNSRPDVDSQEAKILIALKNGKEQLTLANRSILYLKESEQGKGLHSSEIATGLWVKPLLLDNGAVLVEAGRKLVSKEGLAGEETGQFIVAQQGGIPARYNPAQQEYAKEIKAARGFSQDLLIHKYGGREYDAWKDRSVLEIAHGSSTYACFVTTGDYLLYEGEEWRVVSFEDLKNDDPVAYVRATSGKALEIEVWDETGFCPLQVKIEMEKQGRLQLKPEAMPSGIRSRSGMQVSCAFGKRRVILRQGDWLLKTPTGWRNLRKIEEIQQYLNHRLKGELFIFDAVEKEQGRSVMKGHLFDETRTQVQALTLPVDSEKSQSKAARKRKPLLPGGERRAA